MLEEWGGEDCLLTNGLICMTATGRLNTESELLVLLCKCALMDFSSGLQRVWVMQTPSHSSFSPLSPPRSDPRRVPEPRRSGGPGRGNAWTWPGGGSWIIRRLAQCLPLTTRVPEKHYTVYWALIEFYNWAAKLWQTFSSSQKRLFG